MLKHFTEESEESEHCYIDLEVTYSQIDDTKFTSLNDEVKEFLGNTQKRVLFLLGTAGSGKTLFCNRLTRDLLATYDDFLPLFAYPNMITGASSNFVKCCLNQYEINKKAEIFRYRKFLFIIDASDELKNEDIWVY